MAELAKLPSQAAPLSKLSSTWCACSSLTASKSEEWSPFDFMPRFALSHSLVPLVDPCFCQVNLMMGVGLLSLPFALKSSGWVGLVLLWLMAFITNYTGEPAAALLCLHVPSVNAHLVSRELAVPRQSFGGVCKQGCRATGAAWISCGVRGDCRSSIWAVRQSHH